MATIDTSSPGEIAAAPRPQGEGRTPARLQVIHFAGLLSVLAGLALWEFVSRVVIANPLFLAAPTQIFAAIYNLATNGQLWPHIAISAAEFAIGYVIGSLIGMTVGLAMASGEIS